MLFSRWFPLLIFSLLLLPAASTNARSNASNNPDCKACLQQATVLFSTGKAEQAADLLRSWSKRCNDTAQVHLLLSTILVRLSGHNEEAAQEASKAVSIAPESVASHLQYALVLSNQEHPLHASQEFEKVIQLDPNNYEACSSLAKLYAQMHENDRAKLYADKAAELEPATTASKQYLQRNQEQKNKRAQEKIDD